MKTASLINDLEYNDTKPAVKVLLDTDTSKELRIALKSGQLMKEHKTPFPIVVEIFEGHISFGVEGTIHELVKGDLVYLEGGVPHDLKAKVDSIVRLTISKNDTADRVQDVANRSA